MKWLLTFPEDKPSVPYYTGWLDRGSIDHEIILPHDPYPDPSRYEALLLPGGGDVDPARYGETAVHPKTYGINPAQDELEMRLISDFLAAGKPVFGICRGLQILNVAFGGKLIQHVPDALGDGAKELHSRSGSYDAWHGLLWEGRTRIQTAIGHAAEVNSSHHQAIRPDAVGRSLRVAAQSPARIIEAVESFEQNGAISAVQWHPERMPEDQPASFKLREFWKSLA